MCKVLYVDDHAAEAFLLSRAARRVGADLEITHTLTAEHALELLGQGERPNIVLLDMELPQMSGLELLDLIRSNGAWDDLPVVMYTSSSDACDRRAAMRGGAAGFETKPFDLRGCELVADRLIAYCSCSVHTLEVERR